ncbi:MAG: DUF4430 domain-containing protein [Eubacteriales bacterium]|nr:DUF4430 domain-containing protein [Eubacteriales bacterium]
MKKKILKNVFFVIISCIIIFIIFKALNIQNKTQFYEKDINSTITQVGTVSFYIDCNNIFSNASKSDITRNTIYANDEVILYDNDSVYDILLRICKKEKIQLDANYSEIFNTTYVKGIANIYELDYGDLSGWVYMVNDYQPSVGASEYKLKKGDKVVWFYTLNLGKDY